MTGEKLYEAIGEISDNKIKEAKQIKKSNHPLLFKWVAIAACLCLAVLGFFVIHRQKTSEESNLKVNKIKITAKMDYDARFSDYSNLSSTEWETVMDAFESYIGLSYEEFIQKIPAAYHNTTFYSIDTPTVPKIKEYLPHDYVFEFQNEAGGSFKIAICPTEEPIRDCYFVSNNPKKSRLNGTTIVIYGIQDSFMVQFECSGIYYDIETKDITLKELENLLIGITD